MKALIVDDEELALLHFNRMLERTNAFQSIITFQDPAEVLEHSELSAADAVFLDIEMPGINGIELAESIQEVNENIQVIFITAYNEFAIKAFELNAVDYLLKPVDNARLLTTVERIRMNKKLRSADGNTGTDYVIQCFGNLDFYQSVNGVKTYITVKWRTSKARELYAFLLLNQGRTVSKDMLMEMFWPAYDISKASTQLYSTIYQIRKLIGKLPFSQSIENTDIGYILRLSGVKIDTVEWEKTFKEAPPLSAAALTRHMNMVMSYENHYLMENGYLWAEPEKARLAHLWLSKAYELIGFLIQEKNDRQAMDVCLQVEKIEPGDDKIIQYKLQLFNKLGKVEEAIKEYERYKQLKDKIN
ncbi:MULTISPECIES: response regulator [Bacillus]|uniref:response regulator n=1 Tax=Bacillus TaxID=1386 RepID=UPI00099D4B6F|nr:MULTISPECIES: response regulator [Bacillus amyloliquefaciens group]ASZ04948.1 transcriptional regulator [Bacillus velezensis]MCB5336158.1 Protein-glutamate methylesterase/protein-glutamine glutaminase [Bacillus amyloliquefaciens]MCC5597493.1 response regulator [Bacillus velezensis]MDV2631004.1 response regulator [Bacillus velezensis]OPD41464.1 transcriptional regulator [Bacillus amyloliquefaciens]